MEFFREVIDSGGHSFVWCEDAFVFENIPPERWTRTYHLKRGIRIGTLTGEKNRKNPMLEKAVLFSRMLASIFLFIGVLPVSLVSGQHHFMKYLIKIAHRLGWFMGFFNVSVIRFRDD